MFGDPAAMDAGVKVAVAPEGDPATLKFTASGKVAPDDPTPKVYVMAP